MSGRGSSAGIRVHQGDDLEPEGKLFGVVRGSAGAVSACEAATSGFQIDVLNPHVREGVLEIGHKAAEIVKESRAPDVEHRGAIWELGDHADFARDFAAELRDVHLVTP